MKKIQSMFNQNFAKANLMSKFFLLDRQEYSKVQENVFSFNKEREYKLSRKFFHNMFIDFSANFAEYIKIFVKSQLKVADFCTNNLDKLTTSIANVDISCVFLIILCTKIKRQFPYRNIGQVERTS